MATENDKLDEKLAIDLSISITKSGKERRGDRLQYNESTNLKYLFP